MHAHLSGWWGNSQGCTATRRIETPLLPCHPPQGACVLAASNKLGCSSVDPGTATCSPGPWAAMCQRWQRARGFLSLLLSPVHGCLGARAAGGSSSSEPCHSPIKPRAAAASKGLFQPAAATGSWLPLGLRLTSGSSSEPCHSPVKPWAAAVDKGFPSLLLPPRE